MYGRWRKAHGKSIGKLNRISCCCVPSASAVTPGLKSLNQTGQALPLKVVLKQGSFDFAQVKEESKSYRRDFSAEWCSSRTPRESMTQGTHLRELTAKSFRIRRHGLLVRIRRS